MECPTRVLSPEGNDTYEGSCECFSFWYHRGKKVVNYFSHNPDPS